MSQILSTVVHLWLSLFIFNVAYVDWLGWFYMLCILCPLKHVARQFMCADDIWYHSKLCHWLLYMDDACLTLSEVDRFCASWKETSIQSFNIFFCSQKALCFAENKLFMLFLDLYWLFCCYYSYSKVLWITWVFYVENSLWRSWQFCQPQLMYCVHADNQ